MLPEPPSPTYPFRRGPEPSRRAVPCPYQVPAAPLALEPVEAEAVLLSFRIQRKLE
ncbi:MAG TPA: hypothetical protein VGH16_10700 [Candidatus Binatia bacterium]